MHQTFCAIACALEAGLRAGEVFFIQGLPAAFMREPDFDVFISHASEDKEAIARPLAAALKKSGLRVWFDEQVLRIGDRLRQRIDEGLRRSRHGVVILSPAFMRKQWPGRELDALYALQVSDSKRLLLPVWHQINYDQLLEYSPLLADFLGASTSRGVDHVVHQILAAIGHPVDLGRRPLVYSFGRIRGSYSVITAPVPGVFFPYRVAASCIHYECEYPLGPLYEMVKPEQSVPLLQSGDRVNADVTIGVVFSETFGAEEVIATVGGRFDKYLVSPGAVVEFDAPVAEIIKNVT